ncbi:MAG: DinB family protein, partial [Candidatus Thorarchaeota archaeon]
MKTELSGKQGDLLRLGLGARNWLITQISGTDAELNWNPPEGGPSASEIVYHATIVLMLVMSEIANLLGIPLAQQEEKEADTVESRLKVHVRAVYKTFREICEHLTDENLSEVMNLPPPSLLKQGSLEKILRIIAGYHVTHHAGQVAILLR